jgi:N-acetylmuramoyl-L-alanine amidase
MVAQMAGMKRMLYIVLVMSACSAFGEYVDINDLLDETGATLFWNPVLETGMIERANGVVTFSLVSQWIVFDYDRLYKTKSIVRNDNGQILFPGETSGEIAGFFRKKVEDARIAPRVAAIVIDPGHGGKDPGASYSYKVNGKSLDLDEKKITLNVSLLLSKMLANKYPDKRIILTREDDTYKKLEERVEVANSMEPGSHEAVIYLSVHVNAAFNRKARGFEVWYLPDNYRRSLIDETKITEEEKDILPILNTMLEEEYTIESVSLAREILTGLDTTIGTRSENLGMKAESWFVVRNTKMPSVLVEIGFLSNREEALLLNDGSYLKKVTEGIYNGLSSFIGMFENTRGFTE